MHFGGITNLIFPRICVNCNDVPVEDFLCHNCIEELEFITDRYICKICGEPFSYYGGSENKGSHLCQRCIENKYYFSKCRSISPYTGYLRTLLHNYKYNGKSELASFFTWFVSEYYPEDLEDCDILIPVPVFINKLRQREYNQCAVIGEGVARFFDMEYDPFILRKIRDTRAQVDIGYESERKRNVRGAFIINNFESINEKKILLFDDVFTTGSTTNECSKVLYRAGADNVQVLTILRADS